MADDKTPEPTPDLGKLVEAAVAKHGDQTAALKAFASDLYAARDDNKALKAKLPPDGAIILSGDDAKAWGAYQTLGKPGDLRKLSDEHSAFATENAALKRDGELRGVAEKAGVKLAVLRTLAGSLAFETKAVKDPKTGKDVETLHVKDGDGPAVPFDAYAEANWAEFLPALRPGQPPAPPARPPGTPVRADVYRHEPPADHSPATLRQQLKAAGFGSF